MGSHFLLYTSDREHGGTLILGIFDDAESAWNHYYDTHQDENDRYYRIPFVQEWQNNIRMDEQ